MKPAFGKRLRWAGAAACAVAACALVAQTSVNALEEGFRNPPDGARPRVWWHWMNGNITKAGIKLDLEWMKRVGIGGFQNFDASLGTPRVVEKRLVYMTPEWKDAFQYTASLADELGLEMAIAGSPGWSESGGPWVTPAQAMKKYVWSETRVEGGKPFSGVLPKPPSNTGPFQSMPMTRDFMPGPSASPWYRDAAVVAYRAPEGDVPLAELKPVVTSSAGHFDLAALTDGDLTTMTDLPFPPAAGERAWIQFEFARPQTVDGLTIVMRGSGDERHALEASDDGHEFRTVAHLPAGGAAEHTIAFPAVTAKFFRVSFQTPTAPERPWGDLDLEQLGVRLPTPPSAHKIAELVLQTAPRVNRFEEKAAFALVDSLYGFATPAVAESRAIHHSDVIDLTAKMHQDGSLDWTPPPGKWVVLRIGCSLLGITNHPASPEATGLEVDKLSRSAVKAYADAYLGNYASFLGPLMGKRGLKYVITDSWEAGSENWTDDMMAEFAKRRGYDMRPWLPVMAGRVVESAEASDRFLWDFRKTIADLTAENHYDQIGQSLRERGMGRYSESHESGRAIIADGMEVKRTAEIPMSAMWMPRGADGGQTGFVADIRESASVAHIYGQNLVAAESMTSDRGAWAWSPETLKPTADKELASGLNRFVIHTSVHQPLLDKTPGLGLGPFGQWFTRNETWAELAKPWITYLARSSYLLQQGRFVADVIYFYGEDSNITALFAQKQPNIPEGYNFDYVNADALVHVLATDGGRITTPSGMSYRVLALDENSRHMSLAVLRKIRDLVEAGAVVTGPKPIDSPSLSDDQAEFHKIADRLFGDGKGEHAYGKGKVFTDGDMAQVLPAIQVASDFSYTKPAADTSLLFVHRTLPDGEIYWVDNRQHRAENVEVTFRVDGKAPELWQAETGAMTPAAYRIEGGKTVVPLHLDPDGAVFVVFRKAAASPERKIAMPVETALATVDGPWNIAFQAGRGAPPTATFESLTSWSESADTGIKYFSGTGTYTKSIHAPADWFAKGARILLDLGDVKNLAEVSVNGQTLGIVWKLPFRVDVTDALKPGDNRLEIRVTDLWANRLIGDLQPDVKQKYTFTTMRFYKPNSPLLRSGLLGPVRLVRVNP